MSVRDNYAAEHREFKYLSEEYKAFAGSVFDTLSGSDQGGAEERVRRLLESSHDAKWMSDNKDTVQRIIKSASDGYSDQRMVFSLQLRQWIMEYSLSRRACMQIAGWLAEYRQAGSDSFGMVLELLQQNCGFNENNIEKYLKETDLDKAKALLTASRQAFEAEYPETAMGWPVGEKTEQ